MDHIKHTNNTEVREMKILDKEIFEIAQIYAKQAVRDNDNYCWMLAKEYIKLAYGL